MFCVVETLDEKHEKEVCAVSRKWIVNNLLYWPPKYYNLSIAMKSHLEPQDDWSPHPFTLLKDNLGMY